MQSEFGLSTLGRPIVITENGDAPVIRDVFVVVTLLLGAWVLVHVNRSVACSFQALALRGDKTDAVTRQAKSLSRAFLAVFALYNVHQVIHIAHFADNIARPVAYYEPKWLYDKYLLSTMEITFYFNIPVSIFGARVTSKLLRRLAVAISSLTTGSETPCGDDVDPLVGQLSSDIPHLRSLSKKLLLYTSSAAMTVMHYRVESYRLYSAVTTLTIAGEGFAGLALALALWYLIVHVRGLEMAEDEQPDAAAKVDSKRLKRRQWSKLSQSEEPETSHDVVSAASKTASFPASPEDGRGESIAATLERSTRNENSTRMPSVRRRSPARA